MGAVEIIAELSCNHLGDRGRLFALADVAARSGADAIKLQLDNPDGGITIDCDRPEFRIASGPWAGRTLHDLYRETYTPWEWMPSLMATIFGVPLFVTPSCLAGVAFLERCGVTRYKVSSFEVTDIPLLCAIARTRKPVMVSLGCATERDIETVVDIVGWRNLTLMHCVSKYPSEAAEASLARIPQLARHFSMPIGLSDHTLGDFVPTLAVACGAVAIEKHLTLSRADGGPDAGFSMEPAEFAEMVRKVRLAEQAMEVREVEPDRQFVKSMFVVQDVAAGERFTTENMGVIRPGHGLHPRHYDSVLGRRAVRDVKRGEPMAWDMIAS